MTLLARLLQLLNLLETCVRAMEVLFTPVGLTAIAGVSLYVPLLIIGCEAPLAATLAGSVALVVACIITTPDF